MPPAQLCGSSDVDEQRRSLPGTTAWPFREKYLYINLIMLNRFNFYFYFYLEGKLTAKAASL
jgi:hypothetical protein